MRAATAELMAGRRKRPPFWRRCQRLGCEERITHECEHRRYCSAECEAGDEREARATVRAIGSKQRP